MATSTASSRKTDNQVVAKKSRERIVMLEERPRPEWFVKIKTSTGETQWFVRISITGLCVRRYGPFPNKQACCLFLDSAVNELIDGVMELTDVQDKYRLPNRPFQNRGGQYPIIERELILHAPTVNPRTVVRRTARTTIRHGIRRVTQRTSVQ
ncbi:protein of unknown function [Nitrospira defluvii]|jgi:hypothetical protein|uniref:Uncharacterized protein n=1 Tax=Nitrospira defluvii TaxID=330214 RepID=D8P8Q9_9BACT|nr:protein of unknown function [Nitrospira defluvii]